MIELFEDFRGAILLDDDDPSGVRLFSLVPVARIRKVQAAVRAEGQVVGTIELYALRVAYENLHLTVRRRLLDRRRTMYRRGPSPDVWSLCRIDSAVRAQHAGVGSAADKSVGALGVGLRIPAADFAGIAIRED